MSKRFLAAGLVVAGMFGLMAGVEYSGWVLFIGLFIAMD